jgi:threonine synthase
VLTCPACGRAADPASAYRCDCGHPLEFADSGIPSADSPPDSAVFDPDRGVWAFEAFLPPVQAVSLGEGWTPVVDAPTLAPDATDLTAKLEYVSPTGSFKDRGAAVTLALAAAHGVDRVLEDSSGNAGLAIATYAARAGLDARIYVPADAKQAKLAAIERTGADLRRIAGDRQAVTDACIEAVEAGDGWYASHAWHPAFFAGTATFAHEIAAQRGWDVPDAVVLPVGHGTLLLGAFRGFRALHEAGWTERFPRLLGVQAAGVAPLVATRRGEAAAEPAGTVPTDRADGIQIADPAREAEIHDALDATDGDVIAVGEAATASAESDLARAGFHVEPTSAVALAGLREYVERGTLERDADVVLPLTGSGLTA